jgi:hypothetical protein
VPRFEKAMVSALLTTVKDGFQITNQSINFSPLHVLSVILYECEAWSLTLREGSRLRVFENRVLRRIFGPKRDEVTGESRKLHK